MSEDPRGDDETMRLPRRLSRESGSACLALAVALVVVLLAAPAFGQGTGRIVGKVTDSESGAPLPFANVTVIGTAIGNITNQLGEYIIDYVPVGTYVVQVSYMGYRPERIADVVVQTDRSTEINFSLESEAIEAEEVVVEAERPIIDVEKTVTKRSMDDEEVKVRPISTVEEAVATQPGVVLVDGELHVRGGRASEVKYYVDGIAITDAATGTGGLEVSLSSLSGFDLLSGGFDAEYGNVQSGVINLQTREGGRSFSGEIKYMTDDYGAPERTYNNYDDLLFGFGGPFFTEKIRYYVSGEGRFSDTYLPTNEVRDSNEFWGITARDRQSMLGSGQFKLSYIVTPTRKLTAEYLTSQTVRDFYFHSYSREGYWSKEHEDWSHVRLDSTYSYYNAAEHTPRLETEFSTRKLVWRDNVSPTMFYTVKLARFDSDEKYWTHADPNKFWWQAYVGGATTLDEDSDNDLNTEPGYYRCWGDNMTWSREITSATTFKADITNQPSDTHQLKSGFEVIYNELDVKELSLGSLIPSSGETLAQGFTFFDWDRATSTSERYQHNIYRGYPSHGAMYVQDKMSHEGMIVRAGLRLDWSDPGAASDVGQSEIWRERVNAVLSPRLGIAHPISDRDALHFHYGRFYQMPHLTAFYEANENVDEAPAGTVIGYSGLQPEVTTSYQFGAEHQFSQNLAMDVTGFYKDIFGLLATEEYVRGPTDGSVFTYVNKDYASVKGVEFKLTKRFANYFMGNLSYTWLQATGVSSDENQGAQADATGLPRQPLKEIPLDWDERHSVAGFLFVSDPGNWEVTFDYNYGSGTPYTPAVLGQKEIDPESVNSGSRPSHQVLNVRGTKKYTLYGQEFSLFFEAHNVFDKRNLTGLGAYGAEYYTMTGNLGGAYVETDVDGRESLEPLYDPSVYSEGRSISVGISVDW
jgi:outer membrane receptor for ferrienterochelin and colicin